MKIGLLASCLLLTASFAHAKTVLPDGWLLVSGEPLPPASLYVVDSKLNTYGKKYLEWQIKTTLQPESGKVAEYVRYVDI